MLCTRGSLVPLSHGMRELSRPLLVIVSLVAGCLFAALPLMLSRFMSTAADAAVRVAYVTAPPAEAPKLAKAIVHARLAACVNIVPAVVSVYEWEGEMNEDTESLMVIKTRESLQNVRPRHTMPFARVATHRKRRYSHE